MAPKSCNLDKDEAEILKASSPSTAGKTTQTSPSPSMLLKSCEKSSLEKFNEEFQGSSEEVKTSEEVKNTEEPQVHVRFINRCSICQKRVGLLGFRCRCGDLFCGQHRYSNMHDCSFDYKTVGREEIAKANPVVRAAKIIKI